jgi:hypothetical protein
MQQAPKKIWSEFILPQHIRQQKQKLYLSFKDSIPKRTQNAAAEQERETHIPQESETDPRDHNSLRAKKEEDHPPLSHPSASPSPSPPCASAT